MNVDDPTGIALPKSPRVHITSDPIPTDSMVTIRLSDTPPKPVSDLPASRPASTITSPPNLHEATESPSANSQVSVPTIPATHRHQSSRSSAEIMSGIDLDTELNGPRYSTISERAPSIAHASVSTVQAEDDVSELQSLRRVRSNSMTSNESEKSDHEVDWSELERTEESEPRNEESDEVCFDLAHNNRSLC